MYDFLMIPEATDFIADQAWFSPNRPVMTMGESQRPVMVRLGQKLTWRGALREIAAILKRIA